LLKRKLSSKEIKELNNCINKQKQHLSARTDIRTKELIKLQEIEKELKIKGKEHFERYEACISCSSINQYNLTPNYEGGFRYKCNSRGCEVDYGFTIKNGKANLFYRVPDHEEIYTNISKTKKELNKETILNAFGFEYI